MERHAERVGERGREMAKSRAYMPDMRELILIDVNGI